MNPDPENEPAQRTLPLKVLEPRIRFCRLDSIITHIILVLSLWTWLHWVFPRFRTQYADLMWGAGFPPPEALFIQSTNMVTYEHPFLCVTGVIALLWLDALLIRWLCQRARVRTAVVYSGCVTAALVAAILLLSYASAAPGLMLHEGAVNAMNARNAEMNHQLSEPDMPVLRK